MPLLSRPAVTAAAQDEFASEGKPASTHRSVTSFRAPWLLFWVAFLARVAYAMLAHTYRIRPYDDHFAFGWEMGRIARALVTGFGYADPFRGHTGPTAWTAPLYPLLLAGTFKLFGVYTTASAIVTIVLNCAFSALAARNTWEIGARSFNLRVARWSGWLWALYPAAMQFAVRWVWEMNLSVFLFTTALVLALRVRGIGDPAAPQGQKQLRLWLSFGLIWGLLALNNPALVIVLPVLGLWAFIGLLRQSSTHALRGAAMAAVVCFACISPWMGRNWVVFHRFIPLRGNFGVELYLGDGPGANGLLLEYLHPVRDPQQFALYKQMGELAYADNRGELAKAFIRKDPGLFVKSSLERTYFFWAGVPPPADYPWYVEAGRGLNFAFTSVAGLLGLALSVRRRAPAAGLFALIFLVYPLTYYLVMALARFRHPLEPLITILAVYLFQSCGPRKNDAPTAH